MGVVCANCGVKTLRAESAGVTTREDLGCDSCGASLRSLNPTVVECGWCKATNRRNEVDHCERCGGPLPALPGQNPGPAPPPVPRELPSGYRWRTLLWNNVMALMGAAFVLVFFWTIIFPLIGIPLWYFGHRKAKRWLLALEQGSPARGELTKVALDRSQARNEKNPWRIEYTFKLSDGSVVESFCEAWDPSHAERKAGDVVWVVFAYEKEGQDRGEPASAIWPPLH